MNTSLKKIQDMTFDDFLKSSKQDQHKLMKSINLNELKGRENLPFLKKFIAMKVLMEARNAAEDKSLFNMTAQFRNTLDLLIPGLALGADYGEASQGREIRGPYTAERFGVVDNQPGEDSKTDAAKGYRFFHVNQIGDKTWKRQFFYLGWDKDYNIVTEGIKTERLFSLCDGYYQRTYVNDRENKWDLLDNSTLRNLFAKIKEDASYENTLGYDVYCVATFCISNLLDLSLRSNWLFSIFLVPLALAITAAVYAVVLPLSLTLYAVEELLVNPIKGAINALLPNEHEAFIEEVSQIASYRG